MARTRRGAGVDSRRVEERLVEGARAFVTIGPEHRTWDAGKVDENGDVVEASLDVAPGSFVRVEPPPGASDEDVASVRAACEKLGAIRVVVLPRRRAAVVTAPREKRPHRKAREVVGELVKEANLPEEDRAALSELTEAIMSRCGL